MGGLGPLTLQMQKLPDNGFCPGVNLGHKHKRNVNPEHSREGNRTPELGFKMGDGARHVL